jgi:hypothetical protein
MPVVRVRRGSQVGYQFQPGGRFHAYRKGNTRSRRAARALADADQRRALGPRRPSWKPYERLLLRFADQLGNDLIRPILSELPASRVITSQAEVAQVVAQINRHRSRRTPPPSPQSLLQRGAVVVSVASRSARQQLRRAGMSTQDLAIRLGVEPGRLIGIDIAPTLADQELLQQWAATNVSLIRTIPTRLQTGLDRVIAEQVRVGARHEVIRKQLQRVHGTSRSNASRIAVD